MGGGDRDNVSDVGSETIARWGGGRKVRGNQEEEKVEGIGGERGLVLGSAADTKTVNTMKVTDMLTTTTPVTTTAAFTATMFPAMFPAAIFPP